MAADCRLRPWPAPAPTISRPSLPAASAQPFPARVPSPGESPARSATTRRHVARTCPDAKTIASRAADWLHTDGQFDVLVTNPPFAKSGKRNRRYFIDSLILDSHKRLRAGGDLVFVQSSMADIEKTSRRLKENGYAVEIIGSTQGPFRDYYFEDETFMEEMQHVENGFEIRDGTHYETLYVVRARLLAWSPAKGAPLP